MPTPTKTQLTGGAFQDSEGNVLAGGYLTMNLSQDCEAANSQICSGIEIRIQLDSGGNVASSSSTPTAPNQFVWANDVLSPVNSFYKVTGYKTNGQPAWGPNGQQVLSGGTGGGTFNVGTWVPNQVISWTPPLQPLDVEVNGTPLSSSTLLDFEDSATVTWTDAGGGALKANAASLSSSGFNLVPMLQWNVFNTGAGGYVNQSLAGYTWAQYIPGTAISGSATSSKVQIEIGTTMNSALGEFVLIRTLKNSLTTVDITPISFGGSFTPTLSSGYQTSDAFSVQIDSQHDYYFCIAGNAFGGAGTIYSDAPAGTILSIVGGNTNLGGGTGGRCSVAWAASIGAGGGWAAAFPIGIGSPPVNFISAWTVA